MGRKTRALMRDQRAADRAERIKLALRLKQEGWSYSQIAPEVGVTAGTVEGWIREAVENVPALRGRLCGNVLRAEGKARDRQILALRRAGKSIPEIAEALKCSLHTVQEGFRRAIAEIPAEEAATERALDVVRLERWLAALEKKTEDGDADAIRTSKGLIELRSKLLGTQQAQKVEVTGKGGAPVAVSLEDVQAALKTAQENADAIDKQRGKK